jgi:hypothetical protein
MKFLIKLVIAALVIHAAYRIGTAYWDHYKFQDAVQQVAQFGESEPVPLIKQRVMELAADNNIPILDENLIVTRQQRRIKIEGHYTRELLLLPGYTRNWNFAIDVLVLTLN